MRGVAPAAMLLMLLTLLPASARASAPFVPDPGKSYSLFSIAEVQRDGGPWMPPGRFLPSRSATVFSRVTLLLKLSIDADPAVPWVIQIPQQIDAAELIDPNGTVVRSGMSVPVDQRPVRNRLAIVPLPARLLNGTIFYVRIRTSTEVRPPRLMTAAAAQEEEDGTRAVTFFFIGFFVAVGVVFGLLYFNLGERGLLLYALVMFSVAAFEAINKSYAWLYLWPMLSLEWHFPNALAFFIYYAALVGFCAAFLDEALRRFRTAAFVVLAANAVALAAGAAVHDVPGVLAAQDVCSFGLLLVLLAWSIAAYRKGQRAARYYVVAFAGVFIGVIVNRLALDQVIPHTAFTEWILEAGIAWEAVWLALAIASSLNQTARENALLHASETQLQRLASIDGLTSLANRRAFDERLQSEWNRAARSQRTLALLFADVDHFKLYNDSQGHLAGDDCLRRVARAIAQYASRASDCCARYGGEEFAILIPETGLPTAMELAETIRAEVQHLAIPHPSSPMRYVTVSIGVACVIPGSDGSAMRLIADADRALYRAKSAGRNAVVSARDLVAD